VFREEAERGQVKSGRLCQVLAINGPVLQLSQLIAVNGSLQCLIHCEPICVSGLPDILTKTCMILIVWSEKVVIFFFFSPGNYTGCFIALVS